MKNFPNVSSFSRLIVILELFVLSIYQNGELFEVLDHHLFFRFSGSHSDCSNGDAVCHAKVSGGSWC